MRWLGRWEMLTLSNDLDNLMFVSLLFRFTTHMRQRFKDHICSGLTCGYCGKLFTSKQSFKRHQEEQHNPYKIKCDICLKDFSAKRFLKIHKQMVHAAEPQMFTCQICGSHFKWEASLYKHTKKRHPK